MESLKVFLLKNHFEPTFDTFLKNFLLNCIDLFLKDIFKNVFQLLRSQNFTFFKVDLLFKFCLIKVYSSQLLSFHKLITNSKNYFYGCAL